MSPASPQPMPLSGGDYIQDETGLVPAPPPADAAALAASDPAERAAAPRPRPARVNAPA